MHISSPGCLRTPFPGILILVPTDFHFRRWQQTRPPDPFSRQIHLQVFFQHAPAGRTKQSLLQSFLNLSSSTSFFTMRFVAKSFLLAGLVVARAGDVFARFAADQPPLTGLFARQTATPTTSTLAPPVNTISADPWHCATENVTQFFKNAPRPTGNVLSGIQSFGAAAAAPCRATATGIDAFYCSITDPKGWCGFTTAAPQALLSSYSTYLSSVTSFWKASSSTMSVVSYTCPVAWSKPDPVHAEWLKVAMAHAECYMSAHPETSATSTRTGTAASSTSTRASTSGTTTH